MTIAAVADTGPLIHLGEIDSLDLLTVLDRLYVPEIVFEELDTGGVPRDSTLCHTNASPRTRPMISRGGWTPVRRQP